MNRPAASELNRFLGLGFVATAVVVALAFVLTDHMFEQRRAMFAKVDRTEQILTELKRFRSMALTLHTAMRGYTLDAEESSAAAHRATAAEMVADIRSLQALATNTEAQKRQFDELARRVDEQLAWHEQVFSAVERTGRGAGRRFAAALTTEETLNAVLKVIDDLQTEENRVWRTRRRAAQASDASAHTMLTALFALIAVLLAGVYFILRHHLSRRRQAEQSLIALSVDLERRVQERTLQWQAANDRLATEMAEHRDAAEEFRAMFEATPNGIALLDASGRIELVNPQLEELFGYEPVELIGKPIELLVPEHLTRADAEQLGRSCTESALHGREWHGCRKDGSQLPVEVHFVALETNEGPAAVASFVDLTERLLAQSVLKNYAALNQAVIDSLPADVVVLDCVGNVIARNTTARGSVRERPSSALSEAALGMNYCAALRQTDATEAEIAAAAADGITAVLTGARPHFSMEYRVQAETAERWFLMILTPLTAPDGGAVATHLDITERKHAELARARLAAIVESSSVGILSVTAAGTVTSWNQGAERILGYPADEIIGQSLWTTLPPQWRREMQEITEGIFRGDHVDGFEAVHLAKDGRLVPVEISLAPIRDHAGAIIGSSAIIHDISPRRELEAEVLRVSQAEQQRLGRELHDGLGQQLTATEFMCQSLTTQVAGRPELAERARRIGEILRDSVGTVRALAHGLASYTIKSTGLCSALRHLADTTEKAGPARCRFVCQPPVALSSDSVATHLYRIAQEAATNALKHSGATQITISLSHSNGLGLLEIRDNGSGYPPLFAAPGIGRRTMAYRARLIGGVLRTFSVPNGGVRVACTFPHEA